MEISKHLDAIFNANEADRISLGFDRLDNAFLIGRQFNRFVGIAGFTNRGKSLLLRTLAFNAAMSGRKVLYISLEADATNAKTQLAFLLGTIYELKGECPQHKDCQFVMRSYEDIRQKRINNRDAEHVSLPLRLGLPGYRSLFPQSRKVILRSGFLLL
jgi:replicative DNA helicase